MDLYLYTYGSWLHWRRLLGLWVPVVYPVKLDPNGAAQLDGGLVLVHLWQLAGVGRSVDWGGSWWAIFHGVAKTWQHSMKMGNIYGSWLGLLV